jgi:hypothetical protein
MYTSNDESSSMGCYRSETGRAEVTREMEHGKQRHQEVELEVIELFYRQTSLYRLERQASHDWICCGCLCFSPCVSESASVGPCVHCECLKFLPT